MKIEEAKKKVEYYQNGTGWVTSEFIIDILDQLDQPKPKMPQFMLDWVDDSREHGYEFDEWFYYSNQPLEVYKWLNTKNKRQKELNALALVTLIVNGPDAVIVEKEKLYTVEIPNPNNRVEHRHMMLVKTSDGRITLTELIDSHVNLREDIKLTEQEIRKDFDWAWQWKKEVTE
ncbi:DUF1642 domain-containing protein [Streptococcus uberis]